MRTISCTTRAYKHHIEHPCSLRGTSLHTASEFMCGFYSRFNNLRVKQTQHINDSSAAHVVLLIVLRVNLWAVGCWSDCQTTLWREAMKGWRNTVGNLSDEWLAQTSLSLASFCCYVHEQQRGTVSSNLRFQVIFDSRGKVSFEYHFRQYVFRQPLERSSARGRASAAPSGRASSLLYLSLSLYIYIYIERERERLSLSLSIYLSLSLYIYIFICLCIYNPI